MSVVRLGLSPLLWRLGPGPILTFSSAPTIFSRLLARGLVAADAGVGVEGVGGVATSVLAVLVTGEGVLTDVAVTQSDQSCGQRRFRGRVSRSSKVMYK